MKVLQPASPDVRLMANEIRKEFHPDLIKVHIAFVMVETDREIPPIDVKISGPTGRASGATDVTFLIDSHAHERATDKQRRAMLDHAMTSIYPVMKDNEIQLDMAGRPRVKRRRPPLVMAGFPDVLERYQDDSIEGGQAVALADLLATLKTFARRPKMKRPGKAAYNPASAYPN